jgi:hypothetical protein
MTQTPEDPAAADLEQFGYSQELSRSLSFADLLIYGLIFMVPIAPFGIFGSRAYRSGCGSWPLSSSTRWSTISGSR